MSKIVQAVNAMIAKPDAITDVIPASAADRDELFFLYDRKYKWSIMKTPADDYLLYYYPGDQSIEVLAAMDEEWNTFNQYVHYSTKDLGTKEARQTFAELFGIVKERRYDMDKVLDKIIRDVPF